MKEVMAMIRINKMNQTKKALADIGIPSFTATGGVLGRGKGLVDPQVIAGAAGGDEAAVAQLAQGPKLYPKRLLHLVVSDIDVDKVVKTLVEVNQTGNPGDGKIFIMPVSEAIRVRTGETATGASGGTVLDG